MALGKLEPGKGNTVIVPGSGRTVEAAWEYRGVLRFAQSCNVPLQGLVADGMLLALRLVHERLDARQAQLVACVHDELLLEVGEDYADRAREIVAGTMLEAFEQTFPGAPSHGVVTVGMGKNWKEAK